MQTLIAIFPPWESFRLSLRGSWEYTSTGAGAAEEGLAAWSFW